MSRANGAYRMRDSSTVSAPPYGETQYTSSSGGGTSTNRHHRHQHGRQFSADAQTETNEEDGQTTKQRRLTAYERLSYDLTNDQKCMKEITLGKRIGFYRIRGELGSGNFSQVKLGIHALSKEKVAIKILDKTKLDLKTQRLLSREISSMERLHHPNVIRLYEVVETLAKLHLIMEYASGGELFTKISNEGRLSEADAKPLFAQILAAVQHMHENHIIHRDLKAENVFFANSKIVKVGDFGFSTFSHADQTLNTFCGSPPYAAPELFKDESYYGAFVDIWAIGIMLYFMVTGIMPFRAETVAKLKKCILEGVYTIPSYVSDSCQFLVRNILKPVPQDRFSLPEVRCSDWLEGQEIPEALDVYEMNPTMDVENLTQEEREARETLYELGITDDHFKQAMGKDSRSSITGTYRIVLHRIQRQYSKDNEYMDEEGSQQNSGNNHYLYGKENNHPDLKKQSKLCTIL